MHPTALALALTAAVFHAGWNLVVKTTPDRILGAWQVSGGAGLLNVVVLGFTGLPDRRVWGLVVMSAVVQTGYMLLLATAYRVGDLSFVYPIARGSSPLFITAAGVLLLSDQLSVTAATGVIVISASLASLAVGARARNGLGWALATGASVATYTTIDAAAVRNEGSAVTVVAAVFVLHASMLTAVVAVTRGRAAMAGALRVRPMRSAIGAVGSASSYLLVMAATLLAPVGPVTAVRESSVILGVAAGRAHASRAGRSGAHHRGGAVLDGRGAHRRIVRFKSSRIDRCDPPDDRRVWTATTMEWRTPGRPTP